jgi:hypothetical protein
MSRADSSGGGVGVILGVITYNIRHTYDIHTTYIRHRTYDIGHRNSKFRPERGMYPYVREKRRKEQKLRMRVEWMPGRRMRSHTANMPICIIIIVVVSVD